MAGAFFVFFLALYYLVRYRRQNPRQLTEHVVTALPLEVLIIGGLLSLFLVFWVVGASQYNRLMTAPPDAIPIYVTGKQWMWKFAYPDGRASMDVLTVPVGRPIKLVMTSRDVIHSFYVPAFRMKHDVVPGRYYTAWFQANTPGTYPVECAEYCGLDHSRMLAHVQVLSQPDYARWRPTWAGLYDSQVTMTDGRVLVADEAYLTRSMMDPQVDTVAGYKGVMPTYRGVLEEPEVAALVEFIKTLRNQPFQPVMRLPRVEPLNSAQPQEPRP
jgi:cytochrome c oxidase subunit 2